MDEYRFFREVTDKVEGMTFTPLTVQTQGVAGINYKFYCRFCDGTEEYISGHGEPTITSIEKLEAVLKRFTKIIIGK